MIKRPRMPAFRRELAALACAAAGLVAVPGAHAVTTFAPFATAGVVYDSNVFAVPSFAPPFAATGNTALGDTIAHYLIGATATFGWESDDLKLTAQGERFDYHRFDELNHNEYKLDGLFDWTLGPIIDGTLEYSQWRYMAALADILSTQLEINTDRSAIGTARILIAPEWRFSLQPKWHELDSPLPDYPNFGLHETYGTATLEYLGVAKLAAGLLLQYGDGTFHDIVDATRYHQTSEQLTANYAVTGLSSFNGQVGFTQRNSSYVYPEQAVGAAGGGAGGAAGKTSTLTGSLGLHRQISVKTSVDLKILREVDSFVAGANPEITTGGDLGIKWDPDVKFSVALHYRYTLAKIEGNIVTNGFVNRTDHPQVGTLDVFYKARPWLTFRPYFERDQRTSNYALANYTATIYGIELTVHWH
jgi:hypothetical protein